MRHQTRLGWSFGYSTWREKADYAKYCLHANRPCGSHLALIGLTFLGIVLFQAQTMFAQDLDGTAVKQAIERGKRYLINQQQADGSWRIVDDSVTIGVTSITLQALINSGMTASDAPVQRGLQYLRGQYRERMDIHYETYQVALMIMAFAAAKDGTTDLVRISTLAARLEKGQGEAGGWSYGLNGPASGPDPSNTQFAVLGLREAVEAGAKVNRFVWERARNYWERAQNADGGWSYSSTGNSGGSKGSMSVAGVASLVICEQMLRTDEGVGADGTPACCQPTTPNEPLTRGLSWLGRNFAARHHPGGEAARFFYYIYGVERAGRLSGQRFFGDHDWYREGAEFLVTIQNGASGHWVGGFAESDMLATSMSLLFLSKGMAPVLINKLKYGPRDPRRGEVIGNDWNRHRLDVRNLVDLISGSPKWPRLLTTQQVDLAKAVESGGVNNLRQAPVLFITGEEPPEFSAEELRLLKEYIEGGGFIFAAPTCTSTRFEAGFRKVVQKIMPPGEGELVRLTPDHPVFRSEHLLHPESVPLLGVDSGCRTSIMYFPEDLGCLWDYWSRVDPPGRNVNLKLRIDRATKIGVNVMAYATGREPPAKTDVPVEVADSSDLDHVERGLLQIAQIRHDGSWNTAPKALRRLLTALNETAALSASTKVNDLEFSDPRIFQYPILFMHGRNKFSVKDADRQQVRQFLDRGGVLFADACCGAKGFDKSFREFAESLYRDKKLVRVGITHELFSETTGRDIRKLKRRVNEATEDGAGSGVVLREAEPFIEAIEIDGRLAVIYSKYDISCALERQSSGNCEGYLPEDAARLATNIVLYSLLQELRVASPEPAAKK